MGSAESYTELAELAGGFIHEVKNRLSNLRLNVQLLSEDFQQADTPREKRALNRIQKLESECERLIESANEFLRFARINDLERQPSDLTDVVEELLDFFAPTAQAANIDIRRHLPADLPPVGLNREMFKQALLNLFLNAQQAMPNGGVLTIQANLETTVTPHRSPRSEPTRESEDRAESDSVCLYIIDTGEGMTPETAARIFRPFFSTRAGGSGLGLPTARKIIEAHHGTIDVQSAVGRGTRFTIRLPVEHSVTAPGGKVTAPSERSASATTPLG